MTHLPLPNPKHIIKMIELYDAHKTLTRKMVAAHGEMLGAIEAEGLCGVLKTSFMPYAIVSKCKRSIAMIEAEYYKLLNDKS